MQFRKLLLLSASALMLAGCGNTPSASSSSVAPASSNTPASSVAPASSSKAEDKAVKIGVLVADNSGEEALGFKAYYEQYIASAYSNVTFVYSAKIEDATSETNELNKLIGQKCNAILSFSSNDRPGQLDICEDNKVYWGVATGMMDDSDYEECKSSEYFVGQIGPSMATEYAAGYKMGQAYAGKSNVAVYGAFIPNPMHVYRLAGVLAGLGDKYDGAEGEAIVGKIFADAATGFDQTKVTGSVGVTYFGGYDPTSIYGTLGTIIASQPGALLSVGMATTFFATQLNEAKLEYTDIDSFTSSNATNMKDGSLKYLAGKYSSSIGPIFAAMYNAVQGHAIRDDGNAFSISQDYWVATSSAQFEKFQTADSVTNPIFNKTLLDTVIGDSVSYADFKSFVETDRTPA